MQNIGVQKEAIISYWTRRSTDFANLRQEELKSQKADLWIREILPYIPKDRSIRILDVGTGSGFFSILLAEEGYEHVTGIDLTPSMIEQARRLSSGMERQPDFRVMDAEYPEFADESFDVILTRNLTWTLPHLADAYQNWFRILKQGGVLLNFDADYGSREDTDTDLPANHAHRGISDELTRDHEKIMEALPNTYLSRPGTDVELLKISGFQKVSADFRLSDRVYGVVDKFYNPCRMFALRAYK